MSLHFFVRKKDMFGQINKSLRCSLELVTLVYETQNVANSVLAFLIFEKSEI